MSGDVLLSHTLPRAVPSALKGLTSGFGMEPGVSPSPWSPKLYGDVAGGIADLTIKQFNRSRPYLGNRTVDANKNNINEERRQALGLLVPVGSVHYCLRPPAYQPSVLLGALPG
jgi:hypothetical protein